MSLVKESFDGLPDYLPLVEMKPINEN